MNKKELIEKYKNILDKSSVFAVVSIYGVLDDLEKLDEPKKSKFRRLWRIGLIVSRKLVTGIYFKQWIICLEKKEIREWLEDKNNQELFARAWLDGYEVEEEKRYTVVMKSTKQPLYYNAGDKKLFFSLGGLATKFTRKQLEDANFGWVFDCEGIEIEEVEK